MKKVLLLAVLFLCTIVFVPANKSFAAKTKKPFGPGSNLGTHCWIGDSSGVVIKHQINRVGAFFDLNGSVTTVVGDINPAYGSGFFDTINNKIICGYTVMRTGINDVINVRLELDSSTLNGTKVVYFNDGNTSNENVSYLTTCP
ncbi:MAG: hypothetical protein ACYSTS_15315 [Planctomycetota bacterium]|jgi:hypothetical protein